MEQYIPKNAVVAEIERRIKTNKECMLGLKNLDYYQGKVDALNDTLSFLDIIKAKEVNIRMELESFIEHSKAWIKDNREVEYNNGDSFNHIYDLEDIAKHFFELGLKAQKGE